MKIATIIIVLLVLGSVVPVAEARTTKVQNCDGEALSYDTRENTYEDEEGATWETDDTSEENPVDVCARGQAGFKKLAFVIQAWGGSIAVVALAVFALMWMTGGANERRRQAANAGLVFTAFALLILVFAEDLADTAYTWFD